MDRLFPRGYPVDTPEDIYDDVQRVVDDRALMRTTVELGFVWSTSRRSFDAAGLRWREDVVDVVSVPADRTLRRYVMCISPADLDAWERGLWCTPIWLLSGTSSELESVVESWPIPGAPG